MKINNQENWVSIFTILINFIDFHFLLFRFNLSEKRNGQVISFVLDKRKEIQRKFLIVGTHFHLIKLLSRPRHLYFLTQ